MEKTLGERILEGCENQPTPESFLKARADGLIEAEEMVMGQWTSSYEDVLINAKNAMFSDLDKKVEQKIIDTISKYMPKDVVSSYAHKFSRDIFSEFKEIDMQKYNVEKAYNKIQNLIDNTNFFENAFLESTTQGYIGDNDFLFYGITDSEAQTFATQKTDAKTISVALSSFVKKLEQRIFASDDRITRCENELLRLENKIKQVDSQRIAVLKERKQIRQQLKQNPTDKTLQEKLETSKQQETTLVSQISDLSKQTKPIKQEIEYKTADIKRKIDQKHEFDSMLKSVNNQIQTNNDLQL